MTSIEAVWRIESARIVGALTRYTGDLELAEDVAQEVYLAFGRSSVPSGEALGWLSVAAAHT